MAATDTIADDTGGGRALTVRSVLTGAVMCFVIGIAGPYWSFYLGASTLFLDYSVGGAIFLLFLILLLVNGTAALLARAFPSTAWRWFALSPGEMVVVMAMMLVGGSLTTMGLTGYLVPTMTSPYYLANDSNNWQEALWPFLPRWLAPLDANGGTVTIMKFYNKIGPDEGVPWGPWVRPLACWGVFLLALYACMISIMTLMRKQWVDYERLTFPIAQVPQELCMVARDPWKPGSLLRNRWFWAGLSVPFVIGSMTALNKLFPWVPVIPLNTAIKQLGPLPLHLRLSFAVLGFTFLIPNRVAFSVWFLSLCSFALRSFLREYGLDMKENLGLYGAAGYPIMAHQGMGAMIVFVLASLRYSRIHLGRVFRCALGIGDKDYDKGEPSSYRLALIVLAASCAVMVIWLQKVGLPVEQSIVFVLVSLFIFYGITRVVAQCGVSVTIAPMVAPSFMPSTFGSANIPTAGMVALTESWVWMSDIRTSVMSGAAHGMYLARKNARGLFAVMMLAALITGLTATVVTIHLGYQLGAVNLNKWFFIDGPEHTFKWGLAHISSADPPNYTGYMWTGVGATIMILLTLAHRTLFWWPIHPVGFIICSVYWTDLLWATIFLAWAIKLLVTRFGGNRPLRTARLFFLGMILGQFSVAGFWALYDTWHDQFGPGGAAVGSIFWI